jgi:hypothetical protein
MIHRLIFRHRAQLIPEGVATSSSRSIIRVAHNHHGADTVVHAVVTDAPEPPFAGPARGAEATAAHDQGGQAEALGLEAEALLHVVVLDDVDLEGGLRDDERLREVLRLGGGEGVEVLLPLLLGLLGLLLGGRGARRALGDVGVGVVVDGDRDGAPVGAVEHGGGADVQQHDGVPGAEVVLDGPLDGKGGLVGEVDGDADAAVRGGRRGGGRGQRGEEVPRRGGLDRRHRLRRGQAHRRGPGRRPVAGAGAGGRGGRVGRHRRFAYGGSSSGSRDSFRPRRLESNRVGPALDLVTGRGQGRRERRRGFWLQMTRICGDSDQWSGL